MCRVGVTGIFCDECAPGYDSQFPDCNECHPCTAIWGGEVTDVQRASQVLKKLIPQINEVLQPGDQRFLQRLLELQSKLDGLQNLTALTPAALEEVEELFEALRWVLPCSEELVCLFYIILQDLDFWIWIFFFLETGTTPSSRT